MKNNKSIPFSLEKKHPKERVNIMAEVQKKKPEKRKEQFFNLQDNTGKTLLKNIVLKEGETFVSYIIKKSKQLQALAKGGNLLALQSLLKDELSAEPNNEGEPIIVRFNNTKTGNQFEEILKEELLASKKVKVEAPTTSKQPTLPLKEPIFASLKKETPTKKLAEKKPLPSQRGLKGFDTQQGGESVNFRRVNQGYQNDEPIGSAAKNPSAKSLIQGSNSFQRQENQLNKQEMGSSPSRLSIGKCFEAPQVLERIKQQVKILKNEKNSFPTVLFSIFMDSRPLKDKKIVFLVELQQLLKELEESLLPPLEKNAELARRLHWIKERHPEALADGVFSNRTKALFQAVESLIYIKENISFEDTKKCISPRSRAL